LPARGRDGFHFLKAAKKFGCCTMTHRVCSHRALDVVRMRKAGRRRQVVRLDVEVEQIRVERAAIFRMTLSGRRNLVPPRRVLRPSRTASGERRVPPS